MYSLMDISEASGVLVRREWIDLLWIEEILLDGKYASLTFRQRFAVACHACVNAYYAQNLPGIVT